MTAVTESGMRKTENGICKNLLFCEFYDSTRSKHKFKQHANFKIFLKKDNK